MFGLGFSELLLIMVVVLIVFGPDKLPEIARNLGRASGQFRRAMDEFKHEINTSNFEAQLQQPQLPGPTAGERLGCESNRLTGSPLGGEIQPPEDQLSGAAALSPAAEPTAPESAENRSPAETNETKI